MAAVMSFSIQTLRNEEILGFCNEVEDKIEKFDPVASAQPSKAFHDAIDAYSTQLDLDPTLHYNDIGKSKKSLDQMITGLHAHLKALFNYPEEQVSEAAKSIWTAIDQYGSPSKLTFTEAYSKLGRLTATLEGLEADLLTTTHVEGWVREIRVRFDKFVTLVDKYGSERAAMIPGRTQALRKSLCDTWRPLCNYINSLATVSPSAELEELIDTLNSRILSKKNALKQRKSAKNSAASACDSVSESI